MYPSISHTGRYLTSDKKPNAKKQTFHWIRRFMGGSIILNRVPEIRRNDHSPLPDTTIR